jgi:hypothetical protein
MNVVVAVRITSPRREDLGSLFGPPSPSAPTPWLSMALSLAAHAAVVAVALLLNAFHAEEFPFPALHSQVLVVQIPERLFFSRPVAVARVSPNEPQRGPLRLNSAPGQSSPMRAASGAPALPAVPPKLVRARFTAPASASRLGNRLLVQLDLPPVIRNTPVHTPALALWSSERPVWRPKPFVAPSVRPSRVSASAAVPVINAPPPDLPLDSVSMRSQRTSVSPRLPRAPAAIAQLATGTGFREVAEPPSLGPETAGSAPVHVLSLSDSPIRGELAAIPPVDPGSGAGVPELSGGSSRSAGVAAPAPGGGRAAAYPGGDGAATGPTSAASGEARPSVTAAAGSAGRNGTRERSGREAVLNGASGVVAAAPRGALFEVALSSPILPPPGVVAISRPAGGSFDVVVVQSSVADSIPETSGVLSGKPVYTAYLSVGTRKDWIFQYCLPRAAASAEAASAGPVVNLGSMAPLVAPYPTLMFRPQVAFNDGRRFLFIHGIVNTRGRFEQMEVLRHAGPEVESSLLASLARWQLRPARLDGRVTLVEFLLAIPPD